MSAVPAQRPQQGGGLRPERGGRARAGERRRAGAGAAAFLGAPRKEGRSSRAGPCPCSPGGVWFPIPRAPELGVGLPWVPAVGEVAGAGRATGAQRKKGAAAVERTPGERKGP